MNADHRRPSVAYISNASIHWAPTFANTTPAEKAVRVRNYVRNDDGNEDDNMMLIRRIYQSLRSVTAVQDGWFHHVRSNLPLDLKRFWSRLTDSHQCF